MILPNEIDWYTLIKDYWLSIDFYTSLYFPTDFSLFERLVIIGLFFGIFVWIYRKLKGA